MYAAVLSPEQQGSAGFIHDDRFLYEGNE